MPDAHRSDRADQRPDRFATGDKVDARITNIDRDTRKITVSIKALEVADEKEAMQQYGSSDSGASLGDILGAAIRNRNASAQKDDDKDEDKDKTKLPKKPRLDWTPANVHDDK